jgi:hypothetical protein
MAPHHKNNDTGSASKLKRSRDVLSMRGKVNILDLIEIEKENRMRRLPGCMAGTNLQFAK